MDQEASIKGKELREGDEVIAHGWTPEEFVKHFIFGDSDDVESGEHSGRCCSAEELLDLIDEALEESKES